jgi:hypothetical protein
MFATGAGGLSRQIIIARPTPSARQKPRDALRVDLRPLELGAQRSNEEPTA